MLRFRLHSLSVPDWFALSSSFILRFAFTKCSTQIIKSLLANSLRASGVAKQLISSPRAAHPRGNKVYDGETAAEALENVETVISEWIETAKAIGREIPVPKGKLMYA